ncbi:MAG: hypothetical protein ACP5H2_11160 [Solirubrobacteraceae bacterium]
MSSGDDKNGYGYTVLAGRVGTAVRSIVIHRRNGPDVVASISNGWYIAWWPAKTVATHATVITSKGSQSVALPSLATTRPVCNAGHPSGIVKHIGQGCQAATATSGPNSNGFGSDGVSGPPIVGQAIGRPFHGTLLLNVSNASSVLVCFHPPSNLSKALQVDGPTGPCEHATLVTKLPAHYPAQKNLLEAFPKGIWETKIPDGAASRGMLKLVVVPYGRAGHGMRSELTVAP